jgi:hypothetical protein
MSALKNILVFCGTTIFLCLFQADSVAQFDKKSINAVRVSEAPKVDGLMNEEFWKDIPPAKDFIIYKPNPGVPLPQSTEVKLVYTNEAIYVGFVCLDTAPDSILKQLSGRDVKGNSDYCGITFSCYSNGINGFTFGVSPSGEQYDARYGGVDGEEDVTWNAVWWCKTSISEKGWVAEFEIPFAALRFPEADTQNWDINFMRNVRRNRHEAFWNGVNPLVPGVLTQMGKLTDIKGIKPPRRIFLYPYASGYYNSRQIKGQKSANDFSYNAGLDLKLGLSEAFTLDATLIPDFGQTISDQLVLNLSAFELQFNDNRQFFIEGTELFSRAGLFYSRRIGFTPPIHSGNIEINENEKIIANPASDKIINAIKISGRDKNNLGVGFFNAITAPSFATVEDTETGQTRKVQTSSFTNYNVLVFDQNLAHNSYLSVINTNVTRQGADYDANVTGYELEVRNKFNKYSVKSAGAVDVKFGQQYNALLTDKGSGFKNSLSLNKINGNLRWSTGYDIISNTFDPNDLGFQTAPNAVRYLGGIEYNIYKPFGKFNSLWNKLNATYSNLYKPYHFTSIFLKGEFGMTTRKFFTYGVQYEVTPMRGFDYFEPRVEGRYFRTYKSVYGGAWISSDYRKVLAVDAGAWYSAFENAGRYRFNWRVAPRIRVNDHLFITYVYSKQSHINDLGFAYAYEDDAKKHPLFGKRDVISHTNVLTVQYAFNPVMTLNTRVRHYWGYTRFNEFYSLEDNGYLSSSDSTAQNFSFNSFTIDMTFRWIFTQGSELNITWKNAITQKDNVLSSSLAEDVDYIFKLPQSNAISLKVIYFLDYRKISKISRRKSLNPTM